MTRRTLISIMPVAMAAAKREGALVVPVHQVFDTRANHTPEQLRRFDSDIWAETVQNFRQCGIELKCTQGQGEVRRSPGGRPVFTGLSHGVINLVVTDHIPLRWDTGRALHGVTTRYDGDVVCLIALRYAHGNRIPFLALNTCTHELLHVLLQDVYEARPKGLSGQTREARIDWYATRLWLFRDGAAVRTAAQSYLERVKAQVAKR